MTYQSGWSVIEQTVVQRERWPGVSDVKSTPLVYPGQIVYPGQPVLRLQPIKSTEQDGKRPATENVLSGLFGRVMRITLRGGVVIESRATVMKGTFGLGKQIAGILTLWPPEKGGRLSSPLPPRAILVVPGTISFAFLHQALVSGISGIIASSIAARDLEGFLRTDLMQLLNYNAVETAQIHLPSVTLFLIEGLGTLTMPSEVLTLLRRYQGNVVLLSGITSVQRGIFPELVISFSQRDEQPYIV